MQTKKTDDREAIDRKHDDRFSKHDGKHVATVNDNKVEFTDPAPLGRQILSDAGFLPVVDHVLILVHGSRSVGLDEPVDLREPGVKAFWAFMTDRVFRFTIDGRS